MAEKNERTTYTWRNLVQPDVVHAGLFMVKSQSTEQLVLNHCGHSLVPVTRSDLSAGHQH